MKKLLMLLCCAVLSAVLAACGQPSLKTEDAQVLQPSPTLCTLPTAEQPSGSEKPKYEEVSWSVQINGASVQNTELASALESVYMRVGCTPSTGYRMADLVDFAGEGESITGITVTFEDDSYLSLSPEDIRKQGTLLVIATDDEPLEKPMLGHEELIYMVPVKQIEVHH